MSEITIPSGPGSLTQAIYVASLSPARAALLNGAATGLFAGVPYYMLVNSNYIKFGAASQAAAATLLAAAMAEGPVDPQCMVNGWPAGSQQIGTTIQQGIMFMRVAAGYGWVPPAGSGISINLGPGLPPPIGLISNYPTTMPAGWITVSDDAAMYPLYVPPIVPPVTVIWEPDPSNMLIYFNPVTGVTSTYWGVVGGQNPSLGTVCNYMGIQFTCALYPVAEPIGGQPKMWEVTGVAS